VRKAEAVLARARAAMAARDLDALAAEAEPLERTLALFQGLAAGGQAPGGR
jgi:molecular chaperone DnaK